MADKDQQSIEFLRALVFRVSNDGLGFEGNDGWISVLFVDGNHRGRSVGKALLQKVENALKQRNRRRF